MIAPSPDGLGAVVGIAGAAGATCVGAVFLGAGLAKLRNRRLFSGVVANYRLLPERLIEPVAAVLPFAELAIGVALLGGFRIAALPAAMLLLVFALAMAVNIGRGRDYIDCGCGRSELRQPLSAVLLVRNIVLAAFVLPAMWPLPRVGSAEWLVGVAAGVALYLLTQLANALSALARGPLALERNSR